MPVSLVHVKSVEMAAGLGTTAASAYSGLQIAGTVGGIVGSVCAVVALIVSVTAGNAKRRRQYDDDIRAAEQRGRSAVQTDLEQANDQATEWRERYLNLLEQRPGVQPPPDLRPRS